MDFSKLTLGDKIVGGTAIVLILDLMILPWHHVSATYFGYTATANRSGVQSPNALWGWLALLLAIAILVVVILRRLTEVELPALPQPWGMVTFIASIVTGVVLLIKLIAETSYLSIGAFLAILLAGGMIYGAFLGKDEADDAASTPGDGGNATPF